MNIERGLNEEKVNNLSDIKKDPNWMRKFRLEAYKYFVDSPFPNFGPEIDIDFDSILYYKSMDKINKDNWEDVDEKAKDLFTDLGLLDAEEKYLGGVGTQFDSEVIYHSMIKELSDKGVIFCSTDEALKKHSKLFKEHFNKIVKYDDNKFSALNSAVWSGGSFIYVPPHTKLDRPLQSYFRMDTENIGQFERSLIIVDHDSELHYIEGCTAPTYSKDSLHAAVVEIYVGKNSKCRYTTIQNWSNDVYNLVTKRALVEENGLMEWIDGNVGSKINMKYPAVILRGDNSRGTSISVAVAKEGQIQDVGAKMIHLGKNTKSNIISKSIAINGGKSDYRGLIKIDKKASDSKSSVKCDSIIIGNASSDAIPINICENESSVIEHEAVVSNISDEKLFYLMSRGLSEEDATKMIVMGFISEFKEELPMEYAVELNRLLEL